jgi:hypothetical protein
VLWIRNPALTGLLDPNRTYKILKKRKKNIIFSKVGCFLCGARAKSVMELIKNTCIGTLYSNYGIDLIRKKKNFPKKNYDEP